LRSQTGVDECVGLWLLKNSSSENPEKIHRARMPYNDFLEPGRHFLSSDLGYLCRRRVFQQTRLFSPAKRDYSTKTDLLLPIRAD
jgi:hypothetical protein